MFYEKKATPKLQIKNNLAIDLFFKDQNIVCDHSKSRFLMRLYRSKTNEVLNTRTFRAPRKKGDWRALYDNYLRSEKWKTIRENLFKLRGKRCEDCHTTKNLHVHHLHYNTLTMERPEDLKILCKSCHDKEHRRLDGEKENRKLNAMSKRKHKTQENSEVIRFKRNGVLKTKKM